MQAEMKTAPVLVKSAKRPSRKIRRSPQNKKPKATQARYIKPKQARPIKVKPKRTKTAKILSLLSRPSGASIDELCKTTGWQAHSVRGFLSGTVKRKLGLKVNSETNGKGIRRYWIESASDKVGG